MNSDKHIMTYLSTKLVSLKRSVHISSALRCSTVQEIATECCSRYNKAQRKGDFHTTSSVPQHVNARRNQAPFVSSISFCDFETMF